MKIKTLKDLENRDWRDDKNPFGWLDYDEVRELAIKWVKEDIEDSKTGNIDLMWRWMKRFNITEEDLK